MNPLYSVTMAARVLNVSTEWLRAQVRLRRVPHTLIGSHIRFTEEHLVEIVAEGQRRPATKVDRSASPTGRRLAGHPSAGLPAQRRRLPDS